MSTLGNRAIQNGGMEKHTLFSQKAKMKERLAFYSRWILQKRLFSKIIITKSFDLLPKTERNYLHKINNKMNLAIINLNLIFITTIP